MNKELEILKSNIAHEWGHYLAYFLLGYYQGIEGIELCANIYGRYGKTSYFSIYNQPTKEDELTILYAGSVSESLYLGKVIPIAYTDAEKIRNITNANRERILARARAKTLLKPYTKTINSLVEITMAKSECVDITNYLDYYVRIFKDDARDYLLGALKLNNSEMTRDLVALLENEPKKGGK